MRGPVPTRRSNRETPLTESMERTFSVIACRSTPTDSREPTTDNPSQQHGERVGYFLHRRVFLLPESRGYVRIDVQLAEDRLATADQHHQLRFGLEVAGKIVPDGAHVRDVLVGAGRHGGAAHPRARGDAGGLGVAPRRR